MRSLLLATLLPIVGASLAAQTTRYTFDGAAAGDRLGYAVANAGDVDQDFHYDFIIGAFGATPNGVFSGQAQVISGATGLPLWTFDGDAANDMFGSSVAAAGDVNADGFDDVIVGAPRDDDTASNAGSATVFSGTDGSVLYQFNGDSADDLFGISVSGAGDVNADGFDDVIVGAIFDDPTLTDSGSATVFSGRDGTVLHQFAGTGFEQFVGWSVSCAGDVNRDGFSDVVIGTPADEQNGLFAGIAQVYDGRTGLLIWEWNGPAAFDQFGHSVGGGGDLDDDGYDDVIVGAIGVDTNGANSGFARAYSGFDGSVLYTFLGDGAYDALGASVSNAGDLDGDGHADVVVGAPGDDNSGINSGMVRAFSGADGSILFTIDGDAAGDEFGGAVSGAGDISRDGYGSVIAGADRAANNGTESGRAIVVDLGLTGTPARVDLRGKPCPGGTGTMPRLRVRNQPKIGETFEVEMRGAAPNAISAMNAGIRWDLDLTSVGAPGCTAYAFPFVSTTIITDALGFATGTVPIPNQPALIGARFHIDFVIIDAGANLFGLNSSDATTLTVGN